MKQTWTTLLLIFLMTAVPVSLYRQNQKMCDEFVRVHIVAHSNHPYDQQMKYAVRNSLFSAYGENFAGFCTKGQAIDFLEKHLSQLEALANNTLQHSGYPHTAKAVVENNIFPQKEYECFTLPSGSYDALKIVIGDGGGANFFCVMFPPLCISPMMETAVSAEDVLHSQEIQEITQTKPIFKFKILEWLNGTDKSNKK